MSDKDLMSQEEFREWFIEHFPTLNTNLTNLFEDFDYEGESYKPKRLQR